MPDIWFTADTHFNHRAMVEKEWRPFDTVEEMNEWLIAGWNERVKPQDQVWHLGDVGMGSDKANLELVRTRLNGTKHLITGNHDKPWPGNRDSHKHFRAWLESFETIQAFARRRVNGVTVLLSHFPYAGDHTVDERGWQYRLKDLRQPLLHGHVHAEWKTNQHQLNVGVDPWGRPVSLDEVAQWLKEAEPHYLGDYNASEHS